MGTEALIEVATSAGRTLAVDRDNGVIRGVKILGRESRNGRTYSESALTQAVGLYEGKRVYVNHPKAGSARDYRDRFGVLKSVRKEADGLYADHHFPAKHALAEQYCHDAENSPHNVGFSHVANGRTTGSGNAVIVQEIKSVASVDLVDDPATTRGLFESENSDMELQEKLDAANEQIAALKAEKAALVSEKATLQEQLDAKKEADAKAAHKAKVESLLNEHKIPATARTDELREMLEESPADKVEARIKKLAESLNRPKSVSGTQPRNTTSTANVTDGKSFVAAISR